MWFLVFLYNIPSDALPVDLCYQSFNTKIDCLRKLQEFVTEILVDIEANSDTDFPENIKYMLDETNDRVWEPDEYINITENDNPLFNGKFQLTNEINQLILKTDELREYASRFEDFSSIMGRIYEVGNPVYKVRITGSN